MDNSKLIDELVIFLKRNNNNYVFDYYTHECLYLNGGNIFYYQGYGLATYFVSKTIIEDLIDEYPNIKKLVREIKIQEILE